MWGEVGSGGDGKLALDGICLLAGIDTGREVIGEDDAEAGAVFKGTELLEGLGLLKPRGRPGDELEEEVALEAVEAEVAVMLGVRAGIAHEREGRAGEVERVAIHIEDDFDDIGVGDQGRVMNRRGGGDHADAGIALQGEGELVDEGRGDEGFIALDIDDGAVLGEGLGGLGDAVGAAGVVEGGEDGFGAETGGGLDDALVICGDDDVVHGTALLATLPDVLDERLAGDEVEHLARESGRSPAGRNGNEGA